MRRPNWLCADHRVTLAQDQIQWAVDTAFDLVREYPNRDMLTGAISAELEMLLKSIVQARDKLRDSDAERERLREDFDALVKRNSELCDENINLSAQLSRSGERVDDLAHKCDRLARELAEAREDTALRCAEIARRKFPGVLPLIGDEIATIICREFGLDAARTGGPHA